MAYAAPTHKTGQPAFNGAPVQEMQTIDATASPVASPVTINTTQTLVVPARATTCTIISVTNAVQVSEDSTQTAYFSIPAATAVTFPCKRLNNLYLKTGSSTVVSFYFGVA
jgi:hypothetical protein